METNEKDLPNLSMFVGEGARSQNIEGRKRQTSFVARCKSLNVLNDLGG
jgi:hypothetical protein